MKKIIVFVFSVLLILSVSSCAAKETPEEVVDNGLTAIQNLDILKMREYFDNADLSDEEDLFGDDFEDESIEHIELLVDNLKYEIIDSSINGEEATVKAKITNINMTKVMQEYITQAFVLAMSSIGDEEVDEEAMQKEMEEIFIELISEEDPELVTNDVDIKLNNVDGKWKIVMNDDLTNAIFGGLMEAVEELQE